ncbi:MAG: hypothetical protein IPJ79_20015 [Bacteroidetes bacterium]|nr:hypothetical protein [Bacteroidota bacterium]
MKLGLSNIRRQKFIDEINKTFFLWNISFVWFAIYSICTTGSLDSSFDFDGKVITSVGNSDVRIFDATIQYDGKIVVAGSYGSLTACDFILAKYKVNGSLDSSFGSNGVVIVSFSNSRDVIWSLVLQPDQKILVAGETENASKDFIIARYTNNGALDSTFGINGKVILDFNGNYDYAESVVIDTINQKIYAGGLSSPSMGANAKMALARLNIDGSLDNSYNGNGKLLIDLQTSSNEKINCIYVQTDGKLLIAGHSNPSVTLMTIIRLDTLGQFDSTFSSTGIFVDNNINSSVNSIANDYNGKIVAGDLLV